MKFQPAATGTARIFTAYGPGHVMVNGQRYERSIAVSPDEVREDWNVTGFDALNEAHFSYFLALKPEVLLLGTGNLQHFPHPRLYRSLTDAGISVECMDTPAACRTYNILAAENRKVIAAILI
ncbi:MAG TPA: Mth938-like domain-containing protein [Gallionella sp.]